jgi:hypothetical protein
MFVKEALNKTNIKNKDKTLIKQNITNILGKSISSTEGKAPDTENM